MFIAITGGWSDRRNPTVNESSVAYVDDDSFWSRAEALVMGSVATIGILPPARTTMFAAACFFRPLAWALVFSDELGDTAHWRDISDWTSMTAEKKASTLIPDLPSVAVPLVDNHGWAFSDDLATIYRGTLKSKAMQQ